MLLMIGSFFVFWVGSSAVGDMCQTIKTFGRTKLKSRYLQQRPNLLHFTEKKAAQTNKKQMIPYVM